MSAQGSWPKESQNVFVTGGSGYIGSRLIKKLLLANYRVIALVRKGSEHKIPAGAKVIVADPFNAASFVREIPGNSTFIQLLGVPHPSPKKANLFREIDLKSLKASADAAAEARVVKFIYVSVAMSPSKLMKAYQDVRREGEEYCMAKNLHCSFIRPWYVLGPGHWWPILLLPIYGLAELNSVWRRKARAMALVTIRQMSRTISKAVQQEASMPSVFEIKEIQNA